MVGLMRPNKERVRLRFTRAAGTYDQQAMVQVTVADHLMQLLAKKLSFSPDRVLEIGCCTGLLTKHLFQHYPEIKALYVNDLVPDFEPTVKNRLANDPRIQFLPGDIEQIDIPQNLDLVLSSSTLHWLEDLPTMFKKLQQCLIHGGLFCFSIYGTENLREVREVTGVGLDYHTTEDLQKLVGEYFEILVCTGDILTLHFADPLAMLNHLRETGVNALDESPWTRSRLDRFAREYSIRFSDGEQVILTYHPVYCLAQKKD